MMYNILSQRNQVNLFVYDSVAQLQSVCLQLWLFHLSSDKFFIFEEICDWFYKPKEIYSFIHILNIYNINIDRYSSHRYRFKSYLSHIFFLQKWILIIFSVLIFQTIYVIHPKINDLDRIQTCIYVNCTYQYYYYKYLKYDMKQISKFIQKLKKLEIDR